MHALLLSKEDKSILAMKKALEAQQIRLAIKSDVFEITDFVHEYDCIILDSLSPQEAPSVVKRIRNAHCASSIVVLDSCQSTQERIHLYECGADDCLLRPFSLSEFAARLRALMRRQGGHVNHTLRVADLEIDCLRHTAKRGKRVLNLTSKEFALLEYLMRNAGRPLTRSMIMEHVWNEDYEGLTNVVDVFVNMLRRKIDRDFQLKLLRTARGIGYLIEDPGDVVVDERYSNMNEARAC
jgi:DNA-binding response OmpR family regulator